ncbi:MAG: GNAT family N-acetyltransferase [Saprospiraceae bacterium]
MASIKTINPLNLSTHNQSISIFDSVVDVPVEWDKFSQNNLFLQKHFLQVLEDTPPSNTAFIYVIVKNNDRVIGIIYYQYKVIDLYLSLRLDLVKPIGIWQSIKHTFKKLAAKTLKSYVLVCGNMALTGENGYGFDRDIAPDVMYITIAESTEQVVRYLKHQGKSIKAVLIKDFYTKKENSAKEWSFTQFNVQPNMIMDIRSTWTSFDDYIGSMKSKYRVRVRRARKKAEKLSSRALTLDEIEHYQDDISMLYNNVADQASFNLFILPPNYFYSLKKQLGKNINVIGYFDGEKMVGFYTNIINGNELDAHFLGYDPSCNQECQLYLNMLYDLVNDAIELKTHKLILSRTAMEIKSSIGAEAKEMHLYLKHTNSIINLGMKKSLSFFTPVTNWVARSPFK